MRIVHRKTEKLWWAVDKDGWVTGWGYTPKEARRKARQWYMYLTTPDEEQAYKYLTRGIDK
jgi:hypothetical protein